MIYLDTVFVDNLSASQTNEMENKDNYFRDLGSSV
jgi:hypothetical protein